NRVRGPRGHGFRLNSQPRPMASSESGLLIRAYRDLAARLRARPDRDVPGLREMYEGLHHVTAEPEGVCYAETSAAWRPALWCLQLGADEHYALLYWSGGGFQLGSIPCTASWRGIWPWPPEFQRWYSNTGWRPSTPSRHNSRTPPRFSAGSPGE